MPLFSHDLAQVGKKMKSQMKQTSSLTGCILRLFFKNKGNDNYHYELSIIRFLIHLVVCAEKAAVEFLTLKRKKTQLTKLHLQKFKKTLSVQTDTRCR